MKKIDFKSRGFLILVSLLFAILFWAFVMADSNTTRVADVRNVPIVFRGVDELSDKGLVITEKSKDNVSVRIEGGVNVVGYITSNNILAYVELNQITSPGEYEFTVNTYSNNGAVVVKSSSPSTIKIKVEEYVEKQVPVEIIYSKDIPDAYWVSNANVQEDRVTITGGFTSVQSTARAVVHINTDRLIQMYEENPSYVYESSIPLTYVDENSNVVNGVTGGSTIVSIELQSKKSVPVDVQGAIVGKPLQGYSVGSIEQSVTHLDIVGKRDIINSINHLSVEEINVTGIKANLVTDVAIKPIEGITLIGSGTVKVSVNIKNDMENNE